MNSSGRFGFSSRPYGTVLKLCHRDEPHAHIIRVIKHSIYLAHRRTYPSRTALNATCACVRTHVYVYMHIGLRLIISRCNQFYLSGRPDTVCLSFAGAFAVYCAQHARIYRYLQNSSKAKCCKDRRNSSEYTCAWYITSLPPRSVRFLQDVIFALPSVAYRFPICESDLAMN